MTPFFFNPFIGVGDGWLFTPVTHFESTTNLSELN